MCQILDKIFDSYAYGLMTNDTKQSRSLGESNGEVGKRAGSHEFAPPELTEKALKAAFEGADRAGEILKKYYGRLTSVDEKFQAGLVSEADRDSEAAIKTVLSREFPQHQILGEETGLSGSSNADSAIWMIDPLDGTTNYVHRVPFFCSSLGFEYRGQLEVAVVDAPAMGWRYHAVRGQGAFLNGQPIKISGREQFREGLFATGFSSADNTLDVQMELVAHVIHHARGIRRLGAAALDLCMVAEGVFDGFWERGLQPWDTAAGVLIAREAGALATDFKGREFDPRMPSVVCATPRHHSELMKILKRVDRV